MNGRLVLRVGCDGAQSVLREARAEFPFQVLRPRRAPGGGLFLILVTPSGGLLDGDDMRAEITVEADASLHLRTQAATQVHRGRSSQMWTVSVAERAAFSYVPHLLVPHAGARHCSRMALQIAASSRVLIAEGMTAGRMHAGEWLAYEELRMDLDIWRDGGLVARERQAIQPAAQVIQGQLGPYSCHASTYLLGPRAACTSSAWAPPFGEGVLLGASELAAGGMCARVLGQRAHDVEAALAGLASAWAGLPARGPEPAEDTNDLERVNA